MHYSGRYGQLCPAVIFTLYQVDIMTTHGPPYMRVRPSDVNSWSIYHDCWCHEPGIHFYPSSSLSYLQSPNVTQNQKISFQFVLLLLNLWEMHKTLTSLIYIHMSPHLRLIAWPPLEHEEATNHAFPPISRVPVWHWHSGTGRSLGFNWSLKASRHHNGFLIPSSPFSQNMENGVI